MAFKVLFMLACLQAFLIFMEVDGAPKRKWGNYKKYKTQAQEKNYETLKYTSKDEFDFQSFNIEERLYSSDRFSKATETIKEGGMRKAKTRNFWKLFKYIQGANVKDEKIEMTVPVISSWGYKNKDIQGKTSMWFWLPKKYQNSEQPPAPTNEAEIDVWSDTTFYALRYTVDREDNDWEKNKDWKKKKNNWKKKDGKQDDGEDSDWEENKKEGRKGRREEGKKNDWKKKDGKKDRRKKAQILKHAEILENALKSKGKSFDSTELYTAGYDGPWVKKGRRYDVMFKKTASDDNNTGSQV